MPDDFAAYIKENIEGCDLPVLVSCENKNGLAVATAILSVRAGAEGVKTSVGGEGVPLETFAGMVRNCGNNYGFECAVRQTELHRIINQISIQILSEKRKLEEVKRETQIFKGRLLSLYRSQITMLETIPGIDFKEFSGESAENNEAEAANVSEEK